MKRFKLAALGLLLAGTLGAETAALRNSLQVGTLFLAGHRLPVEFHTQVLPEPKSGSSGELIVALGASCMIPVPPGHVVVFRNRGGLPQPIPFRVLDHRGTVLADLEYVDPDLARTCGQPAEGVVRVGLDDILEFVD